MIAYEVQTFKRQQVARLDNLPKPKETLPVPSRDAVSHVPRDDRDALAGAMDIDEELRMKGH